MMLTVANAYRATLLLSVLAAAFTVRLFIINTIAATDHSSGLAFSTTWWIFNWNCNAIL